MKKSDLKFLYHIFYEESTLTDVMSLYLYNKEYYIKEWYDLIEGSSMAKYILYKVKLSDLNNFLKGKYKEKELFIKNENFCYRIITDKSKIKLKHKTDYIRYFSHYHFLEEECPKPIKLKKFVENKLRKEKIKKLI